MNATRDKSTVGAWLLHHDQKLANASTTEFESIVAAGRSARLLSAVSQESATTVATERVAIGADYLGMRHSLSDTSARREFFRQGMLFGHSDSNATQTYLDFAENMVNEFLDISGSSAAQIRTGFSKSLETLPIEGLVEFFSRAQSSSELFRAAVALEDACHSTAVPCPRDLRSLEAKVVIGLISDYSGLSRKDVLGTKENGEPKGQNTESKQDQQGKLI